MNYINPSEIWTIQYSEKADKAGSYPWHYESLSNVDKHPNNEWANSWKVIWQGPLSELLNKFSELTKNG